MKARVPANQSFFLPGECKDPAYKIIRDDPYYAKARAFVDSLWFQYRDLKLYDPHFLQEAPNQFLQRFWEMYLACTLSDRGFKLKKDMLAGPEFYFLHNGRKVWIEAVAPGPGEGEDRVPDYFSREVTKIGRAKLEIVEIPVEQIILRFTNALDNKRIMYKNARGKGIIAPDDLYILAINSKGIPYATHWHTMSIPYFIQAIIPFGNQVLLWDTKTGEIDKTFYQKRENVIKAKGEAVSATAFLSPEFSFVSAVLHSGVYCFNHSATMGDEFSIFHNPSAAHPLDPSAFLWCDQRFYKDGQLEYRPKQAL